MYAKYFNVKVKRLYSALKDSIVLYIIYKRITVNILTVRIARGEQEGKGDGLHWRNSLTTRNHSANLFLSFPS